MLCNPACERELETHDYRDRITSEQSCVEHKSAAAWNVGPDCEFDADFKLSGRRCLAPATSFCEAKGRSPATYYWFGLADDDPDARPPFAFAAIWRHWRGNIKGELVEHDTYSIVTSTPNELVKPIHPDRMPVILDPSDYETWLTGTSEAAAGLLATFPADRMRIVRSGEDAKSDGQAAGSD